MQEKRRYSGKIRAVGIIQIVSSSLWGLVTISQIVSVANSWNTGLFLMAIWNTVLTVCGIIEGVKLTHGETSDGRAALKPTIVGIVWYLIQALVWNALVIVFMFVEIATLVLLLSETGKDDK